MVAGLFTNGFTPGTFAVSWLAAVNGDLCSTAGLKAISVAFIFSSSSLYFFSTANILIAIRVIRDGGLDSPAVSSVLANIAVSYFIMSSSASDSATSCTVSSSSGIL